MSRDKVVVGLDIGGTNTKLGVFNEKGRLIEFTSLPTSKTLSPEEFIKSLAQECDQILMKHFGIHLGDEKVLGVGVGAPMANYFTGEIEFAPNLGWKNVPLKKLVSSSFKTHARIDNDANLGALGEKMWGQGQGMKNFILVTLGTGVGTGLVLNGGLHRGHQALGAEGGHVLIPHEKNRPCSCGGFNHLESYLSAHGIRTTIKEVLQEEWTIEELGKKAQASDQKALSVLTIITHELARGLASMAVLLGPEAVIIGGGVSHLGDIFLEQLTKEFNQLVHFSLKNKVKILLSSLTSDHGAVTGGAALILEEVSGL